MNPAMDAFFNALNNSKTINGTNIVSLNQPVPGNPFSTSNNTVKITIHVTVVSYTIGALNVWKPSRLTPATIPKNPSNNTTAINAKYCST